MAATKPATVTVVTPGTSATTVEPVTPPVNVAPILPDPVVEKPKRVKRGSDDVKSAFASYATSVGAPLHGPNSLAAINGDFGDGPGWYVCQRDDRGKSLTPLFGPNATPVFLGILDGMAAMSDAMRPDATPDVPASA